MAQTMWPHGPPDITPSADEIFRPLTPAVWLQSGHVRVTVTEVLPTVHDERVADLVKDLIQVLDAKEEELTAVREVLSAALAGSHDQHNEIVKLKRRVADLLEARREERYGVSVLDLSQRSNAAKNPIPNSYPPVQSMNTTNMHSPQLEVDTMRASRFVSEYVKADTLKQEPRTFTIEDTVTVQFENKDTGRVEEKLALIVDDKQKLLLNKENARALIEMFGTDETDSWVGMAFEAYFDPEIKFGGKKVGGVRVRAAEPSDPVPF